jgi:Zn2+/Cd2+-exporting ATPase
LVSPPAVENGSSHPLRRAILERAASDRIPLRPANELRVIPGQAVEALVTGKRVGVARRSMQESWLRFRAV